MTVKTKDDCQWPYLSMDRNHFRADTNRSLKKNLSHLSAHVVNHLLRENRKSIPKVLSGKKLLKYLLTLQILNFIPVKLTNQNLPHMV